MHEWKWKLCSRLNEIESVGRTCIKIEYSSTAPNAPAKISTNLASKAKTKQYFEVAKAFLCQPGRAEQTRKGFQRFLGWVLFVYYASNGPFAASGHMVQNPPCWRASYVLGHPQQRKCNFVLMKSLCSGCPSGQLALQHGGFCTMWPLAAKGPFHHLSSVFWQTHLVPCCLQELWICYDTKWVCLMLLRVIVLYSLYLFVCHKDKIFLESPCELCFLRWFSPSLQDESRSLFNGCENQSKKINVVFVISELLLEYGTIQKSSGKKTFLLNCNLPIHKQKGEQYTERLISPGSLSDLITWIKTKH